MLKFTRQPIPKQTEVYQATDGLWYADLLTDISRINVYKGDSESEAVSEIREAGRQD